MTVRITLDLPESLHRMLSERAHTSGTSIQALILCAIQDAYQPPRKGKMVTSALVSGRKLGPDFPTDETPPHTALT